MIGSISPHSKLEKTTELSSNLDSRACWNSRHTYLTDTTEINEPWPEVWFFCQALPSVFNKQENNINSSARSPLFKPARLLLVPCVSELSYDSKPLKNAGVLLGIFFPCWPFCGCSYDELCFLHIVSFLLSKDCLVFCHWKLSNVIPCLQLNEFNLVSLVDYLEHISA